MTSGPAPSSTFFTAPPEWQWLIVCYFFLGGLAGGSYFLAALIDFFGGPADRPLARLGYYLALPAVAVSGLLLILDLRRPSRFWHMLISSETGRPMFKYWSPMSIGSWALLAFGLFAALAVLGALAETGRVRRPGLVALRPPHVLGVVLTAIGGLLGFYVAGYTGVLLSVTNRPIWADTSLLGLLFLVSAASTSAAALLLLGRGLRVAGPSLLALERLDAWVLVLELGVLIALIASLGAVLHVWLSAWGLLLLLGVVVAGMLVPLALEWRPALGGLSMPLAAVLVLIGGFILRIVIVLSSEGV